MAAEHVHLLLKFDRGQPIGTPGDHIGPNLLFPDSNVTTAITFPNEQVNALPPQS